MLMRLTPLISRENELVNCMGDRSFLQLRCPLQFVCAEIRVHRSQINYYITRITRGIYR